MADAYHAYRLAASTPSTRRSSSTTPRSAQGSRRVSSRSTRVSATVLRALGFGEAGRLRGARLAGVDDGAAFAGEYSALDEADLGLATRAAGRRPRAAARGLEQRSLGASAALARGSVVSAAWQRLLAFVPTRRRRVALFALAFAVFWLESLGWPMAKGRDTWDYLVYYLQLFDGDPPIRELQLFRTPLTPLVVGLPLDVGGIGCSSSSFALLYAASIVAWSATALVFGRIPALFTRAAAARLSRRTRRSTTRRRATRSSRPGSPSGRCCSRARCDAPTRGGFVAVGAGIGRARPRPAREPGAAPARSRAARRATSRGAVASCSRARASSRRSSRSPRGPLHNGVRYDDADRRARRTGVGAVPAGVQRERDDRAGERRRRRGGSAS